MKDTQFKADKVSGLSAMPFCGSVLQEVARKSDVFTPFRFKFYALTYDFEKQYATEWLDVKHCTEESHRIIDWALDGNIGYFSSLRDRMLVEANELWHTVIDLEQKLPALTSEQLAAEYLEFIDRYTTYYSHGAITFLYASSVSEVLMKSLAERYHNAPEIIGSLLHQPYSSFILDSERALLDIANETDEDKKEAKVKAYQKEFYFIGGNYIYTPPISAEFIRERALKAKENLANDTHGETDSTYVLTKREETMAELLRIGEILQDQRKKLNLIGSYGMSRFLDEAVKRTKINLRLAERAFWFEYSDLLFSDSIGEKLEKRTTASGIYQDGSVIFNDVISVSPNNLAPNGDEEIKGVPASKGVAYGKAKIILSDKEFSKLEEGDILITHMTRPEFAPIMSLSAAIVTDEGGLTSHAAIVARELKKPCIVGTKHATELIHDGDEVEVNANYGIVKIINRG